MARMQERFNIAKATMPKMSKNEMERQKALTVAQCGEDLQRASEYTCVCGCVCVCVCVCEREREREREREVVC